MSSIKLFRGGFGHVSVLNVMSDLVTHAHPEAHVIIWLEGATGRMTVGDQPVALGPGLAVGINSLEPHSHAFASDGRPGLFLAFYIDPDWARLRRGLPAGAPLFADPAIPMDAWLHRAARHLFDNLCDESGLGDLVDYEIERFIDCLFDAAEPGRRRAPRGYGAGASRDFRVRKAIELMQANICERICFDDVARKVGLSRAHFFSLFKEQMQLTPNVYWNTLRMEEARRQLQTSQDSLISVACNLGFTTPGNFSRFFRDHVGVPPIQYREAARAPW
ncbi:AraC family transcriptional regulator [Hoeflea marina]|uniref:AraC family transcriptional regulator n=1 Tax=Hoeflea marina TaxID=274592 RepID=A0A317PKF3_9HYPH|nr:AraC family transcriptional regulator [Hoeflea marina]PWW01435.1 AraC family transcriptional regulator [Hoeflea marina]